MFQVETFKRDLFDNILNGCSLVVIGHSEIDDFNMVPTLKVLENLRNVIRFNYDDKTGSKGKIYEIETDESDKSDKVNHILIELKQTNNAKERRI
ncbi:MAG: hypothetical protein ACFFAN_07980 [Promethearchaeota archaeon]